MLERNIKKHLNNKLEDWISSVKDESVKTVIKENAIVSGGCFTGLIRNEMVHDYDIYFRTKEAVLAVARYYANLWNSDSKNNGVKAFVLDGANPDQEILDAYNVTDLDDASSVMVRNVGPERVKIIFPSIGTVSANGIPKLEDLEETPADPKSDKSNPYQILFASSNAITLSNQIQVVIRFYGEPEEIHANFDFAHTKAYYDYGRKQLSIPVGVYEKIINKSLVYEYSKYPLCSLFRLRKFLKRGWTIGGGEILKAAMVLNDLDLSNIEVLEDQLIGVDTVYFAHVIQAIRKEVKESEALETNHLISIIDKVFG